MALQDALDRLDKNHETGSDEFDAALDKNQLSKSNEFELEHEEWKGVINSMMMNVYIAGGSVSGNQPTFQLGTPSQDNDATIGC